jgi:hypothetical protein
MDPMIVALPVVMAILYIASRKQRRGEDEESPGETSWHSRWWGLADSCGLTEVRRTRRDRDALRGRSGRLVVLIEGTTEGRLAIGTDVTVHGIAGEVSFRAEGITSLVGKALGGADLEVGDPDFDGAIYARGPERMLRALLDRATRRRLRSALGGRIAEGRDVFARLSIGDGVIRAHFPEVVGGPEEPQQVTVEAMLDLARLLEEPSDLPARLAAIATSEDLLRVRLSALRVLCGEASGSALERATLEHLARTDADAEMRLEAALLLGEEGRPTLASLAADAGVADALSARAIEQLGSHLTFEPARRILEDALRARRLFTAVAAARALGANPSPEAEEPLLVALDDKDADVRVAAAEALGHVGGAQAVLPLKAAEQVAEGPLRKAVREAIARIQERLTGAHPGQLALASDTEGQVALAEDERGRVALPDEPGR